jgi:hypothetical protein
MRFSGAIVLIIVSLAFAAPPAHADQSPVVPGFVQSQQEYGNGWHKCWQRGAQAAFYCPAYPRAQPVAVRIGWWGVAKCALAIAGFVAANAVVAYKIKRLGGIWKAAQRILKAKKEKRAEAIRDMFGEAIGIVGVIEACGG